MRRVTQDAPNVWLTAVWLNAGAPPIGARQPGGFAGVEAHRRRYFGE
jgi:hypothetical protein